LGVHLSRRLWYWVFLIILFEKIPVDALKIDQGFVSGLGIDPEDTAIVTAVVSLSHALGLQAIAEGVETPLQMAELKTLGCEYAQGYLSLGQILRGLGMKQSDPTTYSHSG
jgi:predicted signal transduction protein with EAL and GGDEF domain